MRLPQTAPSLNAGINSLTPARMAELLPYMTPLPGGKYLHWDELRRRPAPDGLSHAEWWTAVALSRMHLVQPLPLLDKQGKAFVFATPSPVTIDLHHIDRDAAGQIRGAGTALQSDSHRFLLSSLTWCNR